MGTRTCSSASRTLASRSRSTWGTVAVRPAGPVLERRKGALGDAGALRHALPLLEPGFLVTYGDSYLPFDYASPLRVLLAHEDCDGVMSVYPNRGQWDASNVVTDGVRVAAYAKGTQIRSSTTSTTARSPYGARCRSGARRGTARPRRASDPRRARGADARRRGPRALLRDWFSRRPGRGIGSRNGVSAAREGVRRLHIAQVRAKMPFVHRHWTCGLDVRTEVDDEPPAQLAFGLP